jgi:hypothetical protein
MTAMPIMGTDVQDGKTDRRRPPLSLALFRVPAVPMAERHI